MTIHQGGESGKIHTVQAERDLEANWEVDLARKLEDYLLKICSGEVSGAVDDEGLSTVNFAEAALLLQGSVQVYSRKVEYLYNLVLHALKFLSEKSNREQNQPDGAVQPEENTSGAEILEENDLFWSLDDIPVDAKNCLDSPSNKDTALNHFVKPPANLVVLEGDCLDIGDGNELESYLLSTSDLYQDFILLDPCDASVVDDYLNGGETSKVQYSSYKGNSTHKSFQSPKGHSVGSACKSSLRKKHDADISQSPRASCGFEANDCNPGPNPPSCQFDTNDGFDMDDRYSEPGNCDGSDDDSIDNDPWKPLNPHEPGNLKVKPFKKVKAFKKNAGTLATRVSLSALFPLARSSGPISPELRKIWESRQKASVKEGEPHFAPPYEKLRASLYDQGTDACNACSGLEDHDENDGYDGGPDFVDDDTPAFMDEDLPVNQEQHENDAAQIGTNDAFDDGLPSSQASLEDLCRSHLDALLASIAESEKRTELAARVSSWKQKIEHNLEEQDLHPPFDIHEYGSRILERVSLGNEGVMPFTDVVKGQEKHDVARSFSALLQLVNNGGVVLDKGKHQQESFCYTAANPFHIRLGKARAMAKVQVSKKRGKSPLKSESTEAGRPCAGEKPSASNEKSSSKPSSKLGAKVGMGKVGGSRCTPDSKRRRKSRHAEPVDVHMMTGTG